MSTPATSTGELPENSSCDRADHCISEESAVEFREKFDKEPFEFKHSLLADHPLFQIDRLKELARYLQAHNCHVHYDAGDIRINQRWDSYPEKKLTFEETFDRVDNAGAWIFLRQIETDPEYGALLNLFMEEMSDMTGRDIKRERKLMEGIIFITSPNRVTSYHIDRECSILMQINGQKQISIFDRDDRDVITEKEIETFWSADNNAAIYREQLQDRAHIYQLKPGNAVHIPVNCPHWLKNGDNVSISLNVNYQFKDTRRKYIYQSNYYLRKLGMNPVPPGKSPLRDYAKNLAMGTLVTGKNFVRNGFKVKPPTPTPY